MSLFEKKAIKASFLQARDPSILAFNRAPNLAPIKTNLSSEFGEITQQQKPDEVSTKKNDNFYRNSRNE